MENRQRQYSNPNLGPSQNSIYNNQNFIQSTNLQNSSIQSDASNVFQARISQQTHFNPMGNENSPIHTNNSSGYNSNSFPTNNSNETIQNNSQNIHFNYTEQQALDSFRRYDNNQTEQSRIHSNSIVSGKVIDLSHVQPFNNFRNENSILNDMSQSMILRDDTVSPDMPFNFNQDNDRDQSYDEDLSFQQQTIKTKQDRNQILPYQREGDSQQDLQQEQDFDQNNDPYLEQQDDQDNDQINMDDQEYFDQIIMENQQLQKKLKLTEKRLYKTESQLEKAKSLIKELDGMKNDIIKIKEQANGDNLDEIDNFKTENLILLEKVRELESQKSTQSRTDDEIIMRERLNYEMKLNQLNMDNQKQLEEYRIAVSQIKAFETRLEQCTLDIESKNKQIDDLQRLLNQSQQQQRNLSSNSNLIENNHDQISNYNMPKNQNPRPERLQSLFISSERHSDNSGRTHTIKTSHQDYIALRNRSLSGEKGAQQMNTISQDIDQTYPDDTLEFATRVRSRRESRIQDYPQPIVNESHIFEKRFRNYQTNSRERYTTQEKQYNISEIQKDEGIKNNFYRQNKVAYDQKQVQGLLDRCSKLEQYCRELVRVNKILDCENRLAIAQLINLTDLNQLNNLSQAINFVSTSGKIYDKNAKQNVALTNIKKPFNPRLNAVKPNQNCVKERQHSQPKTGRALTNLGSLRKPSNNSRFFQNNSLVIDKKYNNNEIEPKKLNLSTFSTINNPPQQQPLSLYKKPQNKENNPSVNHHSVNLGIIPKMDNSFVSSNFLTSNAPIKPFHRNEVTYSNYKSLVTEGSEKNQQSKLQMAQIQLKI
ncbi:UNKNOWN [Stylonychia lemnae]|uniref:Uncharacterized protein n=1 Tax=Stylonychia lemnae TaxID=5949 RepID=A0A078AQB5_STYLE|nr:UNKNOWN [Stylonychia lemnae]|eukprot:CDW84600.1 UNKNOWN [Stylonychia lemnae]